MSGEVFKKNGTRFVLRNEASVNRLRHDNLEIRWCVPRKQIPRRTLMEIVDSLGQVERIDLSGTPAMKVGLQFTKFSRKLALVGDGREVAEAVPIRLGQLSTFAHCGSAQRPGVQRRRE